MQLGSKRLHIKMFYAQLVLYPLDKAAGAAVTLTNKQT